MIEGKVIVAHPSYREKVARAEAMAKAAGCYLEVSIHDHYDEAFVFGRIPHTANAWEVTVKLRKGESSEDFAVRVGNAALKMGEHLKATRAERSRP